MLIKMSSTGFLALCLFCSASCTANQNGDSGKSGARIKVKSEKPCLTVETCVSKLYRIAETNRHTEVPTLAKEMRALGEPGWQVVATLALSGDDNVREVAGAVMAQWSPLNEDKLPAVIAALKKEPGGWPARALMQIPSEAATQALISDVSENGGSNQSSYALFKRLPDAFPQIINSQLLRKDSTQLISGVAGELNMLARLSVGSQENQTAQNRIGAWLVNAASEIQRSEEYRRGALMLLLNVGKLEGVDLDSLQLNLRSKDSQLANLTARFLSQQGDPSTLSQTLAECNRLLDKTEAKNGYNTSPVPVFEDCLDPLARMGRSASSMVPNLQTWLKSASADNSNMILATLGYVGDASVIPLLESKLASQDERDVTASLESLWRLKSASSLPRIRALSEQHWYAPVREFAERVVNALLSGTHGPVNSALDRGFREESLTSKHVWGLPLDHQKKRPWCVAWRVNGKLIEKNSRFESDSGLLRQHQSALDGLNAVTQLGNGLLFGINKGEFGGGLIFQSEAGKRSSLSAENVVALVPHSDGRVLGLIGLAHMMDTGGSILVIGTEAGFPTILQLKRLPSAPESVYSTDSGWLVEMASHGAVLLKQDMSLTEINCAKRFQYRSIGSTSNDQRTLRASLS